MNINGLCFIPYIGAVTEHLVSEKINFPNGMCAHKHGSDCGHGGKCYCCLWAALCYATMDICKEYCNNKSPSSGAQVQPPLHSYKI